MTPLQTPVTRAEKHYNMAHKRGRCIIERCFGMMKRRFPCLNLLRLKLDTVLAVIVAVGVLWNMSVMRHEPEVGGPEPEEEVPGDDAPHGVEGNAGAIVTGQLRRRQLINTHFN